MRPLYFSAAVILLGAAVLFPACKGKDGATGPAGSPVTYVPAVPTPLCASPTSNGLTVTGSLYSYADGGDLVASRVDLTSPGTALSIFMNMRTPVAHQGRFALYTSNLSFQPEHLIIQTNPQSLTANAWNTITLPTNVYLPAGTYFIARIFSNTNYYYFNDVGGVVFANYLYGWSQFPDPFPMTGTVSGSGQDSSYFTTCP